MENEKRRYLNKLNTEIKQTKVYKKRDEDALFRFTNSEIKNDLVTQKIVSIQKNISGWEKEIEEKKTEIKEVRSGSRQQYFEEKIILQEKLKKEKDEETTRKKMEKKDRREKQKQDKEQFYRNNRKIRREERKQTRNISYEYRRFLRNCDKLPKYLKTKILHTPCNRGYIWRGIWFFGSGPCEPGRLPVMFEDKKGFKIIYEWDEHEIRKYEKKGKKRRVLLTCQPRIQRKNNL